DAAQTLVLLAHHDAAPTGRIFDPRLQRWLARRFPGILERVDTSLPLWWPVVGAPAAVSYGAARGRRAATAVGLAGCLAAIAAFADISRNRIVPGANDNLTGVAALLGVATRLRDAPPSSLRLLFVS